LCLCARGKSEKEKKREMYLRSDQTQIVVPDMYLRVWCKMHWDIQGWGGKRGGIAIKTAGEQKQRKSYHKYTHSSQEGKTKRTTNALP